MARVYDLEQLIEPILIGTDKNRISLEAVCICHDRLIATTNESLAYSFRIAPGKKPALLMSNHLKLRKSISKICPIDSNRAILLTSEGMSHRR
jgi:hypothetical protein